MNTQTAKTELRQWNTPTTDILEALLSYAGLSAHNMMGRIERRLNTEHENPLKKINPLLNDPFNWKSSCSFPMSAEERKQRIEGAKNETEKDLYMNWSDCFGTREAVELYQRTGAVTKDLFNGMGVHCNIRTADMVKYLREVKKDEERADFIESYNNQWGHLWTAKDGVSMWTPIEGIYTYAVYCTEKENKPGKLTESVEQEIKRIAKIL